ncbi:hypothetical protein N5D45_06975 [Stenotrophomonas sp. GD03819]|jgi:hypothetical protein|uniref:hypothetical protein n=1 Tax=Stenotrophomonas TaxID=40323 RepID=UPI0004511320|nr:MULTISPECIES: hypothetical protein [Stenotrophomonas]KDE91820.1 hypothetical protein DF40_009295 [Stenotrophomonas maltophilia M30]MBA0233219.1 hypothetical protein [Stenotrophomonas maltophilia]MBA0267258.1 hypothetical protein [Stenotrophomonas maltophilia]MBA0455203.1 hypothetical protein [Stenotrophomonas maltophilia]MDH1791563.1 hypothetical protein [Stenotrophomonas sp. GD03819]
MLDYAINPAHEAFVVIGFGPLAVLASDLASSADRENDLKKLIIKSSAEMHFMREGSSTNVMLSRLNTFAAETLTEFAVAKYDFDELRKLFEACLCVFTSEKGVCLEWIGGSQELIGTVNKQLKKDFCDFAEEYARVYAVGMSEVG